MGFLSGIVSTLTSAVKSVVSAVTGAVKAVENTISSIEAGAATDVNNAIQAIDGAINEVEKLEKKLKEKAKKVKITTGALLSEFEESVEEKIQDWKNDMKTGKDFDIIINRKIEEFKNDFNANNVVNGFGFLYVADGNPNKQGEDGIYVSKIHPWQRLFGYHDIIDEASAVPFGMVIDCEPITFKYKGEQWMIELWKGQYDLVTGCEVGIYKEKFKLPILGSFYKCPTDDELLQMSYVLKKNGEEVFERDSDDKSTPEIEKHWWLTGFKPGEFSNPEDLTMNINITFKDPNMADAFTNGLRDANYSKEEIDRVSDTQISFTYGMPKSDQPILTKAYKQAVQLKNKVLVESYNETKENLGLTKNDPDTVEKIIVNDFPDFCKSLYKNYDKESKNTYKDLKDGNKYLEDEAKEDIYKMIGE